MSDEMMDNLKQAFMKDKDKSFDECPVADLISNYAFGELSPENIKRVEEHLRSCRSCLDLYMDIKLAEEDAYSLKKEKVEVLPGLQQAIKKKRRPKASPLSKIIDSISEFFSGGFGLKPVATFATIAMIMFMGIYVLRDGPYNSPYGVEILLHGRTQIGFRGEPEYKNFLVESGGKMNSGDYFRFQVKIDDDAFVYVVFNDSLGNIQSLEKGYIATGNDVFLPDDEQWFHLDKNTGTEKLYLVVSSNRIKDFSGRVEKLKSDGIDSIEKVFPDATINSFSFEHQ
jgi:hypothetical protein